MGPPFAGMGVENPEAPMPYQLQSLTVSSRSACVMRTKRHVSFPKIRPTKLARRRVKKH